MDQDSTSVSPETITDDGPNRENRRAQPTCVGVKTLIGEIAASGNESPDSSQTGMSASRDLDGASFLDSSVTWARNSQSYVPSQDKQTTCPAGVGYISNRRNVPFSAHGAESKVPPLKSATPRKDQEQVLQKVPSLLKRTSSLVRLSMSLDGKAQVLTGAELSPPRKDSVIRPRASSRANAGLQRSQSMVESGEKAAMSRSNSFSQIPRPLLNSRAGVLRTTWDFYCDGDARSAISATAKAEQSGDAAGAIEQIRKTRMVVNQKRTALSSKTGPTKRVRAGEATTNKPNIVRTSSSFARLQTETHDPKKLHKSGKQLPTKLHQGSMGSPSGDSDKENWLPGTQRPRPILRRTGGSGQGPVRVPRSVLEPLTGERRMNSPMSTHSFGSGPPLSYERVERVPHRTVLIENESTSNDSTEQRKALSLDVSRVARGEEDLDCVQNLLSLSQGAWR